MTTKTYPNETALRDIFGRMKADDAQRIRDAYYKAVEGLRSLADALETADAEMDSPAEHLLIGEHLLACEAIATMGRSELGRVL
jgi:hypothetical protein